MAYSQNKVLIPTETLPSHNQCFVQSIFRNAPNNTEAPPENVFIISK